MKTILTFLVLIYTSVSFAQVSYTINGTIANYEGETAKVVDMLSEETLASAPIKKGSFSITHTFDGVVKAVYLAFGEKYRTIMLLEEGTTQVLLDANKILSGDDYTIMLSPTLSGTPNNELLQQYNIGFDAINNSAEFKPLEDALDALYKLETENNTDESTYIEVDKTIMELEPLKKKKMMAYTEEFAKKHGNSVTALYALAEADYNVISADYTVEKLSEVISYLGKTHKNHPYYKRITNYLKALDNVKIGGQAPAFTMENDKGEFVSLSDFKGQYVFIDFWAHWCVPCVEAFPHLKKLYKKYHKDGLEIINISQDPERAPWHKALKKYKNPWPQLIEKKNSDFSGNQVSNEYLAKFLPYTYLLDKEGKILAVNPTDEELDELLKNIFKKKNK